MSRKKIGFFLHIVIPLLTKLVWSRRRDIALVLSLGFYGPRPPSPSINTQKEKKLGQSLTNLTEQPWSITQIDVFFLLVIKDWSISDTRSHLAGGMTYHDGNLTVPTPGRYYIYTQLYYHSTGRVYFRVNSNPVTMIQPLGPGTGEGALYAGGVFNLNAGDVISLDTPNSITLYVFLYHCYFCAFLI